MLASAPKTCSPRLCSVVSEAAGEDPIGSAWAPARYIVAEIALPWPTMLTEARGFPQELVPVVMSVYERGFDWGLIGIAPDEAYARPGLRRVIDFLKPSPPLAEYERREYLVPEEDVVSFVTALLAEPTGDSSCARYLQESDGVRDLLVCTHGTVDACCAKFGYPVYRKLRRIAETTGGAVRVWRCTHFGGHRFAATALNLPDGRYWGRLADDSLEALLIRNRPVAELRLCYRGWSCLPSSEEQVAEREAFIREGWAWTRYLTTSRVEPVPERDGCSRVVLSFLDPASDRSGEYEVIVEPGEPIRTMMESGAEELEEIRPPRVADVVRRSWR